MAAFATFLFLTYYLQQSVAFSPIETGLVFLPLPATRRFVRRVRPW